MHIAYASISYFTLDWQEYIDLPCLELPVEYSDISAKS